MPDDRESPTSEALLAIYRQLSDRCDALSFAQPVAYVYNPLAYARAPWEQYVRRFAGSQTRTVFLGMNPGPWGMAQTGVPFGEVTAVAEWMGITAEVGTPAREHPKRPVLGFGVDRSEVSGRRLWGLMMERFGSAGRFFSEHFVLNYCPLVFMEESSRNRTPDKLPAAERSALFSACDTALVAALDCLDPEWLVGVGRFAEDRLKAVASRLRTQPAITRILHPSPASPAANAGWAERASAALEVSGVWQPASD